MLSLITSSFSHSPRCTFSCALTNRFGLVHKPKAKHLRAKHVEKSSVVSNPDTDVDVWFTIFGSDEEALPKDLAEWKKSETYKLIGIRYSKNLATLMLKDFLDPHL